MTTIVCGPEQAISLLLAVLNDAYVLLKFSCGARLLDGVLVG